MTKIIWISDLHFVAKGLVQGHAPRARLQAAIAFINTHHTDATACVVSGDMVDLATPEDYQALGKELSALNIPLLPMVGNHDDRALLQGTFPLPDNHMPGFVQHGCAVDGAILLCLDTLMPGSDAGEFCEARLNWLEAQLAQSPDTPHLLFLHHPPMPLGLPMLDPDRMRDGERFLDLITGHANVAYLLMGHVHRPLAGHIRGIPFCTIRSALYQAPPPEPAWDWDSFEPAKEAPELGVLTIGRQGVTLHMQQFCSYEIGTA